jgi:translation initiation factor IF-2
MAIKLIKACKELNIGISTAVDFCAKQGKGIAVDPNTRIDDDLYLLLAKEFNKDMAL